MENLYNWPDMSHDGQAVELAKAELGWDGLTEAQRRERSRDLLRRAQEFKEALKAADATGGNA